MIADPRFAPRRADLPWLRRRRLPRAAAPGPQAPAPPAAATSGSAPPLADFITGHSTAPGHRHAAPTPQPPTQRTPRPPTTPAPAPAASSSLDLDEPAPAQAPAPLASSSLDLDEPAPSPGQAPGPPASSSLDLDDAPTSRTAVARPGSAGPPRRVRTDVRVRPGERIILTPSDPTITLTRLQSGIGTLTVEAATSAEVGDLRLGCAYELAAPQPLQMTMQMTQGSRLAPPHSKRPLLLGSRDRFEKVALDLRQCRRLQRLVVYAFSEARRPLQWGGTVVVTTFGGGRIEVPLDSLQGGDLAVLLSIYQVAGELVVRAEMQALNGDVRDACRAYGYDQITWLDGRTPVD